MRVKRNIAEGLLERREVYGSIHTGGKWRLDRGEHSRRTTPIHVVEELQWGLPYRVLVFSNLMSIINNPLRL